MTAHGMVPLPAMPPGTMHTLHSPRGIASLCASPTWVLVGVGGVCVCVCVCVSLCLFVNNYCLACRLIPSSTPFLSFSSLVYTSEAPEPGLVAPGMHVGVTVTFTPNSLHDVDDVMVVETGQGSLQVPLLVRRDPPTLTLPQQILIGPTLVSNKQVCDI